MFQKPDIATFHCRIFLDMFCDAESSGWGALKEQCRNVANWGILLSLLWGTRPAPTDEKIDVFYVGGKLPEHDPSLRKVLKYMPGRYVKSKSEMKWTQGPKDSSTFGSIEWDEKRRRWIHTVGGQVLFCLPCDDVPAEETTPAAQGWQATSTAIPAPEYRRYRMVSLGMLGILWCNCHMYSYVTCRKTETSAIRTAMSVMQVTFCGSGLFGEENWGPQRHSGLSVLGTEALMWRRLDKFWSCNVNFSHQSNLRR